MALPDFFSNKTATENKDTAIDAPALSTTKVIGTVGTVIGLIGAGAAKLSGPTAVKVASIGGGTLVILGVMGIIAVDMIVRQRAEAAKQRWGDGKAAPSADANGDTPKVLVPDRNHLVLQSKHSGKEYEVLVAELDGEKVTLVAHDGEQMLKPTFQPRA